MLLEDFYEIQKLNNIDENRIALTVALQKNHDIFKGHFPNFPVTPGVALLQILKNCVEKQLQTSLQLHSSSQIKFLNLVNPNEETILIFHIEFVQENDYVKVKNTTSFKDGRSVLKCNVTFVKK